jgi:hypothetical protein
VPCSSREWLDPASHPTTTQILFSFPFFPFYEIGPSIVQFPFAPSSRVHYRARGLIGSKNQVESAGVEIVPAQHHPPQFISSFIHLCWCLPPYFQFFRNWISMEGTCGTWQYASKFFSCVSQCHSDDWIYSVKWDIVRDLRAAVLVVEEEKRAVFDYGKNKTHRFRVYWMDSK